jgi:hypothetical protein
MNFKSVGLTFALLSFFFANSPSRAAVIGPSDGVTVSFDDPSIMGPFLLVGLALSGTQGPEPFGTSF